LRKCLQINGGIFSPILDTLLAHGDYYLHLADLKSYLEADQRLVRNARVRKINGGGRSALDLPPLDLGRMLKPLGCRGDWYEGMLEGRA
jgi:hypothetical protein